MSRSLKHQLIGAIVLTALAVIFIPMLFSERVGPVNNEEFAIPAQPEPFESLPLPDETIAVEAPDGTPGSRSAADNEALFAADSPTTAAAALHSASKQSAVSAVKVIEQERATTNRINQADKKEKAALAAAIKPKPETKKSTKPKPETTKAVPGTSSTKKKTSATAKSPTATAASDAKKKPDTAKKKVEKSAKKSDKRVKNKFPVTPGDAWVVQLGSFSDPKNAKTLLNKLKKAGFTAYIDTTISNATTSHKVRVGPELSKQRSEVLRDRLAKQFGTRGMLVPYQVKQEIR